MKTPFVPRRYRKVIYVLAYVTIVALVLTLWLVDVRWLVTPDGGKGLFVVKKSFTGHYVMSSRIAVNVKDAEGADVAYVARLVAKSGDEVSVAGGYVTVNGSRIDEPDAAVCSFIVSDNTSYKMLHEMERLTGEKVGVCDTVVFRLSSIKEGMERYLRVPTLKNIPDVRLYPYRAEVHWNGYNWGPIRLPKKGDKITLDLKNVVVYGDLIRRYEGRDVEIDGSEYVFAESYVCTIDDNRDVSADSRYYGLVPESRVLGNIATRLW